MIDRRTLLAFALTAPFAASAGPAPHTISTRAARTEFLKILAFFNSGDVPGFLAYGPPLLIDHGEPIAPAALPMFFESLRNFNGKPDERPASLDRDAFVRKAPPAARTIFGAALSRSVWIESWTADLEDDSAPGEPGYHPRFEQWNIFFEGARIVRLERWLGWS